MADLRDLLPAAGVRDQLLRLLSEGKNLPEHLVREYNDTVHVVDK